MTKLLNCTLPDTLSQFYQIICDQIGLIIPENEQATLSQILCERVNFLKMGSQQAYLTFLKSTLQESDEEWAFLANRLRIGESYFFRDSGQMSLLETSILPELLQRNEAKRKLNILSAGCSTGEETYSMAILLDRILPDWNAWNIKIIGVDIDEQALDTASKGLYSKWSFRRVPKTIKTAYFEKHGTNWQIHSNIQSKVAFRRLNLVKYNFIDDSEFIDMDLIVCRNVFIYFRPDSIKILTDKFADILNPDGYLLTGHSELYGIQHPLLAPRIFSTSVIYQKLPHELLPILAEEIAVASIPPIIKRRKKHTSNKIIKPKLFNKSLTTITSNLQQELTTDVVSTLRTMFFGNQYDMMLTIDTNLIAQSPHAKEGWKLLAQASANLGQHIQAEIYCNKLLEIDAFFAPAYFIMAHIALERGEALKRKKLLKKALYLDHNFVAPMLELADIRDKDGKYEMAKKLRQAAYKTLIALPPDAKVDMLESWTVKDLLEQVRGLL